MCVHLYTYFRVQIQKELIADLMRKTGELEGPDGWNYSGKKYGYINANREGKC